jgi:hypothetical protein
MSIKNKRIKKIKQKPFKVRMVFNNKKGSEEALSRAFDYIFNDIK